MPAIVNPTSQISSLGDYDHLRGGPREGVPQTPI